MRQSASAGRVREWVVDYSAARAKAIEWLGDRYLLAKPINRSFRGAQRHSGPPQLSPATDLD